jgi:hypothetical protein
MCEPVVHLELDPCSSEEVQALNGLEHLPSQQSAADRAGTRIHQVLRIRMHPIEWEIPSEAGPYRSHLRIL